MNTLVVLSLGNGDLVNGFEAVTAQLWEYGDPHPMKFTGRLPAAPEILELYRCWQLLYEALYRRLNWGTRLEIEESAVTNVSEVEFSDLCQQLSDQINDWLNSKPFRNIDQQLRTRLDPLSEIRFVIETNDNYLQRLPWHLWNFFEDYPKAEVALSASEYQRAKKSNIRNTGNKVKILAILGNSKGIDTSQDRAFLEQLSDKAFIEFLVEPPPEKLNDQLWEKGWDILFFAGHSSSQKKGQLQLNQTDSLTLEQLRYALKKAIAQGLKLAIFNSCDGLGLAHDLADLHIPQVIVMREPVPDRVAQEFLRHFLAAFSGGQSLYTSVREARERLQKLEDKYPCATWLPAICQNPAEVPTTWQEWCEPKKDDSATDLAEQPNCPVLPRKSWYLKTGLLLSFVITGTIMGVRHLGMLQTWELQAFDHLMRLRPDEGPDERLLVITVTEADIQAQNQEQRKGSLSDRSLFRLLEKLEQYQPQSIGLDIYRDFPVEAKYKDLATRLQKNERFVAICRVSNPEVNDPGVPPPPEIPVERLGFSDVVLDPDGIIRRHLLAMTPAPASPCTASYALSSQLAFRYLEAKGISPKFTPEGNLQLGNIVFKRLKPHTGGYQQVDTWGNQVLLNYRSYRSLQNIAPQVTLTQALNGQLNPNLVKDRIVLIGVTATSAGDYLPTPYSAGQSPYQKMAGVLIQAQMVSQILSAVLDRRPLLWVWTGWVELLWVWGWSLIGGMLALRFGGLLHLVVIGVAALGILYGLCFVILIQGGWVPLIPSAIALVVTNGSLAAYIASQARQKKSIN